MKDSKEDTGQMSCSRRFLDKRYWKGATEEMESAGLALPKDGHYVLKLPLPTVEEAANKVALALYTKTVLGWFDDVKGEQDALRDEMTDWRDNMEGANLENTPKYEEVQQAADALENKDLPYEVPVAVKDMLVEVAPHLLPLTARCRQRRKSHSRGTRHAESLGIMGAILDTIKPKVEALGDKDREAGREFIEALESYKDEVGGVEFPGMY